MSNIINAIKIIYPKINGAYVYWKTKQDGSAWENPIDGLIWENTEFEKPTWEQISQALVIINSTDELNNLKTSKIAELETNYIAAQKIQLQNGHTFIVDLKGDNFRDIERQVTAANILGKADILAKDLSGSPLVIRDIPKATWILFYGYAKKISVNNLILKNETLALIKATQSINNIESININPFPAITSIALSL